MEERALIGSKEIAEYLRWKPSRVVKHSKEMQKAGVVIMQVLGRGSQRKRRMYTFPSLLQRFLINKYS